MDIDPVDSDDPEVLRRQLLRLRDRLAVVDAQNEVAAAIAAHRDHVIADLSARLTAAEEQLAALRGVRASSLAAPVVRQKSWSALWTRLVRKRAVRRGEPR